MSGISTNYIFEHGSNNYNRWYWGRCWAHF